MRQKAHGATSEQFMRHHYGASGAVKPLLYHSQRRKRRLRVHRPFTVGESFYHSDIGQRVIPINGVDPDQPGGGEWLVAWVLIDAVPDPEKWAQRVAKAMNRTRP